MTPRQDSYTQEPETPRCDKCGAEITTGLMAAFCPLKKDCEFWTPAVDEFMEPFRSGSATHSGGSNG